MARCHGRARACFGVLALGGLAGLGVFRIWGIVDAFGGPDAHNRKVRALRERVGMPLRDLEPYVQRARDGGATAGLSLKF